MAKDISFLSHASGRDQMSQALHAVESLAASLKLLGVREGIILSVRGAVNEIGRSKERSERC